MELPEQYKKLMRVTIYLTRYEKQMAEIEAARLSTSLADLGRTAVNAFVLSQQLKAGGPPQPVAEEVAK